MKIKGPLEIVSPRVRQVGDEWIAVDIKNNQIHLSIVNSSNRTASAFLSCRNFVVQARSNRGVRIKVHSKLERAYLGRLIFSIDDSKPGLPELKISNEIPTSDYVASVVGSESPPNCPPEALKALAVLVTGIVERKKDGEFVGDSTKEQAYNGCECARADVVRAVKSVLKKRLFFNKSPIQPFYHSTCAGGTSRGEDIFGEGARPLTYLESVKCVYCTKSPFWKTKSKIIPAKDLENIFDGGMPTITKFDSEKRPTEVIVSPRLEKRPTEVIVSPRSEKRPTEEIISPRSGGTSEQHMSGYEAMLKIGRARGWGLVPGTRYRFQGFKSGGADFVKVQSSGAGHGVGLCQWGAAGLAERGKTCDEILKFYFPRCHIVTPNQKD